MDMELAVVRAVADMDRAHDFYEAPGWPLDADFAGDGVPRDR